MNIETADRLLNFRKQHKLRQEELAEKIGVSRQAVSKWERGEASPDTDNLILLADLYGVSLDELLRGKKDDTTHIPEGTDNADNTQNNDTPENDDYVKSDHVSFHNGIHVTSKNGDSVHISLKDGINVEENNGNKVNVGWNGIHVEENGTHKVYTDKDGNVMINRNAVKQDRKNAWTKFPVYIVAIIGFLAWGFSGICHGWALSWICFLGIPLYYTLVEAVYKRDPAVFSFPILTAAWYVFFGFTGLMGGWAFGWIVFLTIPIYYWICHLCSNKNHKI